MKKTIIFIFLIFCSTFSHAQLMDIMRASVRHPKVPVSVVATSTNSLVSWWRLEDVAGTAVDSVDGNNGANLGGVLTGQTGKFNNCYTFDGVDDQINIPNSANLGFTTGSSWTICAWVYWTKSAGGTGYEGIVGKGNDGINGWMFGVYEGDGQLLGSVHDTAGFSTLHIAKNGWRFVAWKFCDATDTETAFYGDGTSAITSQTRTTTGQVVANSLSVQIAKTGNWAFFPGSIDEVMIYNTFLTDAQVNDIYTTGQP